MNLRRIMDEREEEEPAPTQHPEGTPNVPLRQGDNFSP